MKARADLHVHSRYSDRPSEWLLRRIGAPESFTEPRKVYERARASGMDFVTISDHNCIRGALEIAHLPGTFISNEVTTYFPEDGCKIHLLVFGISEAQFDEIERLRPNIYELRDYLLLEDVPHSVAHPLFSVNGKLGVPHVEKLLLLFKRFEAINGARDPRASILARAILNNLTGSMVLEMADRHGIDPKDREPWQKHYTAGSDDHGGLYIASAYTETPTAATVEEFLDHLRNGDHGASGSSGSSLKLARSFYAIAYEYYRNRLVGAADGNDLVSTLFEGLLKDDDGRGATARSLRFGLLASKFASRSKGRKGKKSARRIDRAVIRQLQRLADLRSGDRSSAVEQRCFEIAAELSQQMSYAAMRRFSKYLAKGKLTESLQTASSIGPIFLCIAPYLAAFHTQHKDAALHQQVARHFPSTLLLERRSSKRAWFTDTLHEVNGVAVTIRTCAALAETQQKDLSVVTCCKKGDALDRPNILNFEPVGRFQVPEYDQQELSVPPFLEILRWCEREQIEEIVVSTPGPLGLVALAAARSLGCRIRGIYHTDFPQYVRYLTDSPALEGMTESFMRWFYGQMDVIYAPSGDYARRLESQGLEAERIRILPRGVDARLFTPEHRNLEAWRKHGATDAFKFLYVGRISKEKNLEVLLHAFDQVEQAGCNAELVLVGDGPHLKELKGRFGRRAVTFTGYLQGEDLATAYASSDVFVFPSTTDTFGNAVLEAQASGLPAIVTDQGGCQEVIAPDRTGLVVEAGSATALAVAMEQLYRDRPMREVMGKGALEHARASRWEDLLTELCGSDLPTATPGVGKSAGKSLDKAPRPRLVEAS